MSGDLHADAARTISILCIDYRGNRPIRESIVRRVFERGWRSGYEQKGASFRDLPLFYDWAGAVMERDLAPKRAPGDLARIHQWTMRWKEKAIC